MQKVDWKEAENGLLNTGYASLGKILTPAECGDLVALYAEPKHFRSRIQMERYRFGRGEYQYMAYPLPKIVSELRSTLYGSLAEPANRWMTALGLDAKFPPTHKEFVETCHTAGQERPTPLLLRYHAGDFNCLHQDLYGSVFFPFQVIFCLSRPRVDFEGGELLLVEQQPRAQSIGHALSPEQGEAIVITTRYHPAQGKRGYYRTNIKHGVSPVRSGERYTMGVIFHDAE